MKEVEVKARVRNKTELLSKLSNLGIELSDPFIQSDQIFVPQNVNVLPAETGVPVLRIRDQGDKKILTLKIRLSNGLDKEEHETPISNADGAKGMVIALGFKPMVEFSKTRRKAKHGKWEICVDEVKGLGDFVEMEELTEDGDSEKIQNELFGFLQKLGITEADREHFGYDVIMWKENNK